MVNGFVYVVTFDNALWRATVPVVKIGCAKDVHARISGLNTASPINLTLVASIQSPYYKKMERLLHQKFASARLNGEWFTLDPHMVKAFRSEYHLVADRFDELFNFDQTAHDYQVQKLTEEVRKLQSTISTKDGEIRSLKNEIDQMQKGQYSSDQNHLRRFLRDCSRGHQKRTH